MRHAAHMVVNTILVDNSVVFFGLYPLLVMGWKIMHTQYVAVVCEVKLTVTTLWANSADDKLINYFFFFLFLPKNKQQKNITKHEYSNK